MRSITGKIIIAIMILTSVSCSNRKVYQKYRDVKDYRWDRHKEFSFEVPIEDIKVLYDFYLLLRVASLYPYKNLKIIVKYYTPSGETRMRHYDLMLRDKDNKLKGEGLGDIFDMKIPLRKEFKFEKAGIVRFEIGNKMPRLETPGIMEVGLRVERSE